MAELLPGRAVLEGPRDAQSIFPLDDAQHGPFDVPVITDAVSALFDKIGPGILVTHSQSGGPGWVTAMKNPNVRAVVAYEPGSGFVFPEGEVPAPMPSAMGALEGVAVPLADFQKLTKIPIVVYYGDNIPEQPTASPDRRQLAGPPRDGAAVARRRQPARRRRDAGAPPGDRHPRQHAFSVLRPEQRADRRPHVGVPEERRTWIDRHKGKHMNKGIAHCLAAIAMVAAGASTVLAQGSPAPAAPPAAGAQPSRAQQLMGEIAPKLADLTDNVLFGDVWERPHSRSATAVWLR